MDQIDRGSLHWIPVNISFILCNHDESQKPLALAGKFKIQNFDLSLPQFSIFFRPKGGPTES